ncbi:XRE family transcriptional regulator [Pseudaminobacter arsenicus]|uniref:XRE family transcriptional regulator n=1 Tax=Borborobacter arsenicus TaxID=1851146 RepID=A0A432UZ02_9HYPH|nr:XRE family transcriptional regulator [Pseudaminobacter arsenicus]
MARVGLGWGVRDLAQKARVSTQTITRFEKGEELRAATLEALRQALEEGGVEFIPGNGGGPGVRMKK